MGIHEHVRIGTQLYMKKCEYQKYDQVWISTWGYMNKCQYQHGDKWPGEKSNNDLHEQMLISTYQYMTNYEHPPENTSWRENG